MPDYAALERVKAALNNPRIGGEPATIWSDHSLRVDDVRALLSLAEKAGRMEAVLEQQRGWVHHWQKGVEFGLTPTPESLKAAMQALLHVMSPISEEDAQHYLRTLIDAHLHAERRRTTLAPASPEGGG